MNKKIIIACFFATIMILLPISVVAGDADIRTNNIKSTNEIVICKKDFYDIYKDFITISNSNTRLKNIIPKSFSDASSLLEDGTVKINLKTFGNVIQPVLKNELSLYTPINNKGLLSIKNDFCINKNGGGPVIWDLLRNLIPSLPPWREDNDCVDTDGPDEKGPNDGHGYRGLDDYMDWNFIEGLIEDEIPLWVLFTIVGLIGSFVSLGVLLLWLIPLQAMSGIYLVLNVFEAFDIMDLSYQLPGNKDGL